MLRQILCAAIATAAFSSVALADEAPARPDADAQIDYAGFQSLTENLEAYRDGRRVSLDEFKTMAGDANTIVLDARSATAFAAGHIDGAVNLPFSDFNAESLARVLGPSNRRVLIYCNNNFSNNAAPVMLKRAPLALNIPTFINLYGYGYRDIYELRDVVDFNDPEVGWVRG